MKEGDLITTYYKGFFRLNKIERRFYTQEYLAFFENSLKDKKVGEEYSPLYHFTQEYDAKGNLKTSNEKCCDASFCQLASDFIKEEVQKLEDRKVKLLKIVENENK